MISTSIQVFNFQFSGSFTNRPLVHCIGSCKKRTKKIYGLNILGYIYQRCLFNTHMVRKSTRTKHVIFGPSCPWHTNQKLLNAPWVICILARLSAQGPWDVFWLTRNVWFHREDQRLEISSSERHPSNRTTGITMTLPHNRRKRMCLWQDVLWYSSIADVTSLILWIWCSSA